MPARMDPAKRLSTLLARTEEQPDGCLLWTGPVDKWGYASAGWSGKSFLAHRLVYILSRGEIPSDRPYLDHVCHTRAALQCTSDISCRHRRCLNPDHLEPVTAHENVLRSARAQKTHCVNGHEYTVANTYVHKGSRFCRKCAVEATHRYQKRKATDA